MVTIEMLLKTPSLRGMKTLTGHDGLNREIRAISVMDAPDSYRWLKGDELILTSGFLFGGDVALMELYLMHMIEAGSSCLGIKKERFLSKVPDEILRIAEQHHFPVIEIPHRFSWSTVMSVFYELFYDISENTFIPIEPEVIEQIYNAGRRGSRPLMDTLTELFQVPLAVLDDKKKMLMENGLPEVELMVKALEDFWLLPENAGNDVLKTGKQSLTVCRMPFSRRGQTEYLAIMSRSGSFIREMNKLFHLLDTVGERTIEPATDKTHIYHKFMASMLSGGITEEDIRVFEECRVARGTVHTGMMLVYSSNTAAVCRQLDDVLNSLRFHKKWNISRHIVENAAEREAVVMLELHAENDTEAPHKWQRVLFEELEHCMKGVDDGCIAMGRLYVNLKDVPLSLREAREAHAIGRVLWEDRRCFLYSFVSAYSVLHTATPSKIDIGDIQLLENSQASFSFDGIKTLEAYIECRSYKKAADKLYIHENSLRYRIQRIEDFLNVSVEDPMVAHTLFIQLKLWKLLQKKR